MDLLAGQTLTLDADESCSMDTIVQLYDAVPDPLPASRTCFDDADAVACDDDGGDVGACSRLLFTAPADGTYWARVIDYLTDDAGVAYVMNVDVAGP